MKVVRYENGLELQILKRTQLRNLTHTADEIQMHFDAKNAT